MEDKQVHPGGHSIQAMATPSPPLAPRTNVSPTSASASKRTPEREDSNDGEPKRRRVMRACDVCRRRKIRCDGPTSGTGIKAGDHSKCTHCRENRLPCTYVDEPTRKAARPGLVKALQERCQRLEHLVQQLQPGFDLVDFVGPCIEADTFEEDAHREVLRALQIPPLPHFKTARRHSTPTVHQASVPPATLPRRTSLPLSQSLPDASVWSNDAPSNNYPSSTETKRGELTPPQYYGRAATHTLIHALNNGGDVGFAKELEQVRRPGLWQEPDWEVVVTNEGRGVVDHCIWPEDEQAAMLFDAFFANVNSIFPLLHKKLFCQQYYQRLYIGDNAFARVCLMVLANGARYAPSARFTQWPGSSDRSSAGWRYLGAFMKIGSSLRDTPSLLSLQASALLCMFLCGNVTPSTVWSIAGTALRSAQELGSHVRPPPASSLAELQEREQMTRTFWCLYHLDRSLCVSLGRSVAIPDSEITAALPRAVDDAFWDEESFLEQPAGIPSELDAFTYMITLDRIVSTAIETIPVSAAENPAMASAPRSKERISMSATMINLIAVLNNWIRSLPPHLQWGDHVASLPDEMFIRIAHLHARYNWAVIYVHYGGVAVGEWTPGHSILTSTQSAQSIFAICESLLQHRMYVGGSAGGASHANTPRRPIPFDVIEYVWLAASITLVAINSGSLPTARFDSAMTGINTCISTLVQIECVSRKAGQMADLLSVMRRNVVAQAQVYPLSKDPNQLQPPPLPEAIPLASGTQYTHSVYSIPSVPSASFPTPGPAPTLLPADQVQPSPDPYPWLVSPQYATAMTAAQGVAPPSQPFYYTTEPVPVGTGPLTGPPVLSIHIPGENNSFVTATTTTSTTHTSPVSATASTSVHNISPIDPLPLPLPEPGVGVTYHQPRCAGDERWSHLVSSFAVALHPHPELHHLQLQNPNSGGSYMHHP